MKKVNSSEILLFLHGDDSINYSLRELFQNMEIGLLKISKIFVVIDKITLSLSALFKEFKIEYEVVPDDLNLNFYYSKDVRIFYSNIFNKVSPAFSILLGWRSKIPKQFCKKNIINIHFGPLESYDKETFGSSVHQEVFDAYLRGDISSSFITIHKVVEDYNNGDVIFKVPLYLSIHDGPESILDKSYKALPFWLTYMLNNYVKSPKDYIEILC